MNRAAFFAAVRRRDSGVFGASLSQQQVEGVDAILDSLARHRVTDNRHGANVLGQVYHETGGYMLPIKETVYASHRDKNPSDATVMARLESAWKAGRLPWVKTPYWRDGWFGRGPIQLTHRDNYDKMGRRLGVDLVRNPALALDKKVGADIAVVGMLEGMFTGKSLADYFNRASNDPLNARRIVNGDVAANGQKIAGYHRAFLKAIEEAGGLSLDDVPTLPPEKPSEPSPPAPAPSGLASAIAALFAAILRLFKR